MNGVNTLDTNTTSFWKKKKMIILIPLIIASVVAIGFLLYRISYPTPDQVVETSGKKLIPDSWLAQYFQTTNPDDLKIGGFFGDPDEDKLTNYQEYLYNTDPTNKDTDGDGYFDGTEVAYGTNPLGEGKREDNSNLQAMLRQQGIYYTEDEVRKEFGSLANEDRAPYIQEIVDLNLRVSQDQSPQAVQNYLKQFVQTTAYTNSETNDMALKTMFALSSKNEINLFVQNQQEVIDKLLEMEVPADFVESHQIQIKLNNATLGIAKLALLRRQNGEEVNPINFWPEINYMLPLDVRLGTIREELFNKYQVNI